MRQGYASSNNYTVYYYITNLQGDVIRLVDVNGSTAAYYEYDPYGNAIQAAGSHANINPLRYRGYVYDTETTLYYLQSRYYDPKIGRFLNADALISTGQGILGNNMFTYCNNNPVNYFDPDGQEPITAVSIVMVGVLVVAVMVASYCAARLICELGGWVVTTAQIEWRARISHSENEEETLPRQGLVEGNPDAPPVDAGKQGKHVPGHNNHDKNRSSWPKGKNGVKQTQEAWENGVPDPKVPSGKVKIGIASDGTVVRVHINDKGAIHGYPLYPCP